MSEAVSDKWILGQALTFYQQHVTKQKQQYDSRLPDSKKLPMSRAEVDEVVFYERQLVAIPRLLETLHAEGSSSLLDTATNPSPGATAFSIKAQPENEHYFNGLMGKSGFDRSPSTSRVGSVKRKHLPSHPNFRDIKTEYMDVENAFKPYERSKPTLRFVSTGALEMPNTTNTEDPRQPGSISTPQLTDSRKPTSSPPTNPWAPQYHGTAASSRSPLPWSPSSSLSVAPGPSTLSAAMAPAPQLCNTILEKGNVYRQRFSNSSDLGSLQGLGSIASLSKVLPVQEVESSGSIECVSTMSPISASKRPLRDFASNKSEAYDVGSSNYSISSNQQVRRSSSIEPPRYESVATNGDRRQEEYEITQRVENYQDREALDNPTHVQDEFNRQDPEELDNLRKLQDELNRQDREADDRLRQLQDELSRQEIEDLQHLSDQLNYQEELALSQQEAYARRLQDEWDAELDAQIPDIHDHDNSADDELNRQEIEDLQRLSEQLDYQEELALSQQEAYARRLQDDWNSELGRQVPDIHVDDNPPDQQQNRRPAWSKWLARPYGMKHKREQFVHNPWTQELTNKSMRFAPARERDENNNLALGDTFNFSRPRFPNAKLHHLPSVLRKPINRSFGFSAQDGLDWSQPEASRSASQRTSAPYPSDRVSAISSAQPNPGTQLECTACQTESFITDMAVLPCKHAYCANCTVMACKIALAAGKVFGCCKKAPAPLEIVTPFLHKDFLSAYSAKFEEMEAPILIYCSRRGCGAFIPSANIKGPIATCIKCRHVTCSLCKAAEHKGVCPPDKDGMKLLSLAGNKKWTQCKRCQRVVERTEGCLHMRCPCGREFCMSCGGDWKKCGANCPGRA